MEFGADTWWLFGLLVTACVGAISYFLKRTMSVQDEHGKELKQFKDNFVSKSDLKDFKDGINKNLAKQDEHDKDINHIKQTYVSKEELKEFKDDNNKKLEKIQTDVDDIKSNTLTRKEFLNIQSKTENKLDRIYEILARREYQE